MVVLVTEAAVLVVLHLHLDKETMAELVLIPQTFRAVVAGVLLRLEQMLAAQEALVVLEPLIALPAHL